MKKLDLNRDGRISDDELMKILSGKTGDIIPPALLPQVVD
jgi:Ca2+-binding EF-hand superfamily protein